MYKKSILDYILDEMVERGEGVELDYNKSEDREKIEWYLGVLKEHWEEECGEEYEKDSKIEE